MTAGSEEPSRRAAARATLLACLDRRLSPQSRERLAQVSAQEWAAVFELARQQRVRPQLLAAITTAGLLDRVPTASLEQLRDECRGVARTNLRALLDLQEIGAAARIAGIRVIALKGMHLAAAVYPSPGLREMKDIDVLVPSDDGPRLVAILQRLGYAAAPLQSASAVGHLLPMVRAGHLPIEIHYRLTADNHSGRVDPIGLLSRATPLASLAGQVDGLSHEDLLLHLCAHATYNHTCDFGLRPVCDLAELLGSQKDMDWSRIEGEANNWGARGIRLALRLAHDLTGAAVPASVITGHDISDAIVDDAIEQTFTNRDAHPEVKTELAMLAGASARSRLNQIAQRVRLDPGRLTAIYGAPPRVGGFLLWRVRRFTWLMSRHGRTGWRLTGSSGIELAGFAQRKQRLKNWLSAG